MHDVYFILAAYLREVNPDLVFTDRMEDVYVHKNIVIIQHQFIRDNVYTEATVTINQDIDNKEMVSFLLAAELTQSRLAPRVQLKQSRMIDGVETEYISTYLVKFDVLEDEIIGLEGEDGLFVTPHQLLIQINITKLKEEIL